MSTVDLDAIRHLFARYAAATWDEEDGLARDLADEVPALIAELERSRVETQEIAAELAEERTLHQRTIAELELLRGELAANEVSR